MKSLLTILLSILLLGLTKKINCYPELYSDNTEQILKIIKKIIMDFEESVKDLVPHFMNDEKMLDNKNFYNDKFVEDMNTSFDHVENIKERLYSRLRSILAKAYKMSKLEKAFDLNLPGEDQLMMKFIINLKEGMSKNEDDEEDEEDEEEDSKEKNEKLEEIMNYWHQTLSSKNGMFASLDALRRTIVKCSINLVNFYDNMEDFSNQSKMLRVKESSKTIAKEDIRNFKYITGFLTRMREMYLLQNEIFKEINQNMLTVSEEIKNWSEDFGELKEYMTKFMAGTLDVEREEEEEIAEEIEKEEEEIKKDEEKAEKEEEAQQLDYVPKEGNNYKPDSDTQINSDNPHKYEKTEDEKIEEIEDPIERQKAKAEKEFKEKEEIKNLAVLRIKEMESSLKNEKLEKQLKVLEQELEESENSVKTCNQVLLMNYFIDGNTEAREIPENDPIPACPDIRYSCCKIEEIEKMRKEFVEEVLPKYAKKYYLMRKMFKSILKNYTKFVDLAYDMMKIQGADPICHASAENIIYTPIGKHFIDVFFKKLEKAHKWLLKAKSSYFCTVCNQKNHHTIKEYDQILLKREFCQSYIDNTFDMISIYYLNITDFFNNIKDMLQCDKNFGKYSEEVELEKFGTGPLGKNVIKNCLKQEKAFCIDYCVLFKFSDIKEFVSPNIRRLQAFYEFTMFRMNDYFKMEIPQNIDSELFHIVDDESYTERFGEGYIRLDNSNLIFSQKFEDSNASNPVLYGVTDETIKEATFVK